MDAFYSIRNFTIQKRVKRGTIGDERLLKGALFAAYVKDLSAWSRVIVKAKYQGIGKNNVVSACYRGAY